jgi:hypothetical protein
VVVVVLVVAILHPNFAGDNTIVAGPNRYQDLSRSLAL